MRHWIVGGTLVLIGTVLVFRSRVAQQSTVAPANVTTRGVSLPNMMPKTTTAPATTRGVPLSAIKGLKLAAPGYDVAMERRVPPELLLVRAQPAVVRVIEFGNLLTHVPDKVRVDLDALNKSFDATGTVAALALHGDPRRVAFCWDQIAADPDAFLTFDGETVSSHADGQPMASGTGFFVSRDGTLLTNAHVIADMDDQTLTDDPAILVTLVGTMADSFMDKAVVDVGGPPTAEQLPGVATAVLRWFGAHGRISGTFDHAEAVLRLRPAPPTTAEVLATTRSADTIFDRPEEPFACRLRVVAKGSPIPGKDVAILRAEPGDAFDPVERAICLSLGDSADVLAGTRVQAIGFPGIAFNSAMMRPDAEYRASAADGQIANTKPMSGGWDALEMTADINHGDSGGPVVAASGVVIGLNVGAATEHSGAHTLAVPINLAREMLAARTLTPDPGPATALWIDALAAYGKADYAGAVERLERLAALQAKPNAVGKLFAAEFDSNVNPYVVELLKRARAKAK